jgi:hypothetical protein
MRNLGQTAKQASGKIEAVIAGAVLVVVIVLFAKYYDKSPAAPGKTGPTVKSAAKPGMEN